MTDESVERLVVQLAEFHRSRFFGKYRGLVRENEDPENLGRIRALIPEVLGSEETSGWALPCVPYAGDGEGQFMIPPVDAGVWIEFEGGDVSRPIWSGCWWSSDSLPESNEGDAATPPLKIIRSENGLMLALDDNGHTINVSDENGDNMMRIEVNQGKITIQSTSKVIVEAPQIELVENARHPIVFGDDLLQYLTQFVTTFNTHMHPGETVMGMPVSPVPPPMVQSPPTPALLSQKVKSD